jgi:short-subunit dehydrogenase
MMGGMTRPAQDALALTLGVRPLPFEQKAFRRRIGGRCVVVTGASRGVGRAVAGRCAAAGAHVVLMARRADALTEVADHIRSRGGTADVIPVDLRDTDAACSAGERVVAEHGAPALLVSNAGHSVHRDVEQYTDRFHDVTRLVGVNMLGPIALALPVLAAMIRARSGQLVSVGSVGMTLPGPGWSVYTASKAGYDAWLRSVSPELQRAGISTSSVHLPLTRTAMSSPTYSGTRLPSLSPADAATWVCRAVVTRQRVLAPWWARVGGVLTVAAPTAADRLAGTVWRRMS